MAATTQPSRRRADAERSIAAILDAGLACFASNPETTMTAVARAAAVGRVTLYAHFPSREALLEAVLAHALDQANAALDSEITDQEPAPEALARLIHSSWRILDRHGSLLTAATRELGLTRLREHHARVLARVERLIARGQRDGVFRTDLPRGWLVTTFYSLMHAAAEEVDAGRLAPSRAAGVLQATLLAALAPPPADPRTASGTPRKGRGATPTRSP